MNYLPQEAKISLDVAESVLKSNDPEPLRLKKLCWSLMLLRSTGLGNALRQLIGNSIYSGPFKGMTLIKECSRPPLILGCYEHELHPVVEDIIARGYDRILNIGCSLGYYAVGFARRMPQTKVEGFDIDPGVRALFNSMVELNGVGDRVCVSGEFFGKNFETYANEKTLVFMDIEGAEEELLNPEAFPALKKMDVVVELHDVMRPGISEKILKRFEPTHTLEVIQNKNILPDISALLPPQTFLDPYDHMLLGWESRDGFTPWGVFRVKTA
ncbi:MAG: class I SAM-dependent methyltransferase [Alphaproteobacteria bacterium]|nr:class I SAM-dependent methyltransferase [Alphaproteobacteria bacterium]